MSGGSVEHLDLDIIMAWADLMVRALELCCEFTPPVIGGVSPSDPPRPQRDLAVQL